MAGSGRIKGITIEIGGDTTKLVSSLKKVDTQIRNTQNALKDVNKLLKMDPGNTELLRQKQKLLTDAVASTKERLEELERAQSQVAKGSSDWDALQREIIETRQDLEGLENDLSDFGSVGTQKLKVISDKFKEIGDSVKQAGQKISDVGKGMTATVTAPIVGGLAASAKSAVDFEDAMAKVSTIADSSQVSIEDLAEQITNLSNETGVAATEVADNVYNAISAGQDTADAVNFVGEATKLAVAGFAETGDALDILTTIMNAYGLEAEDVTRVSDVLINTQNLGKTTVAELSSAMGKAIPTAKANGVEIEDLASAYAVMTSNGIATAETTTYLNSMMNELGKQGTSAAKAFAKGTEHIKEGGLTMAEAMESGWELSDVLSILDDQAAESGTTIANLFGSAEAGKAASVLWDNADKLNDVVEAMGESAGATDEAFAKMDTTSRQAQIAMNQVKNSAIELGGTILQMLAPYFQQVVDKIKQLTSWFNNLDEGQKQMIVKVAAVVAAIGPALIIIGQIVSAVGTLITVIGALANPVGLVITAILALVAAFTYFYNTNEQFRETVNNVINAVMPVLQKIFEFIKAQFLQMVDNIRSHIETIKAIIRAFVIVMEWLKGQVSNAVSNVKNLFTNMKNGIYNIFTDLVNKFKTWGKDMIENFIGGIKEKWQALKDTLSQTAESIKSYLGFSEPALGPLSNFHTYAPDMMKLFAQGITQNANLITDAVRQSFNIQPIIEAQQGVAKSQPMAAPMAANNSPIAVNVTLQGDAKYLYKVVNAEAIRNHQITGISFGT